MDDLGDLWDDNDVELEEGQADEALSESDEIQPEARKSKRSKKQDIDEVEATDDEEGVSAKPKRRRKTVINNNDSKTESNDEVEVTDGEEEEETSAKSKKRKKTAPKTRRTTKKFKSSNINDSSPNPGTSQRATSQDDSPHSGFSSHPGVIKSLHLQNFMCHTDFTHHFHPNLNFITGQNGSGKSALLSGILIALGGKAVATSRTSSLKDLVQKKKSTARVGVTLLNKNGLSRYGEEITIERWISVNGGGGYRLKTTGGEKANQWRSLKKTELDNILLGLNIQIDNPVAILNQEVARSFLRSKDPKAKFNLFYDGTLLRKLESVLSVTNADLEETGKILSAKLQVTSALRDEVKHLKSKCEKIAELNQIKGQLGKLHNEYLWAKVIEQEKAYNNVNSQLEKYTEDIGRLKESLAEMTKKLESLNEETITKEQTEVRSILVEKRAEVDNIRKELNRLKTSKVQLSMKIKTAGNNITGKEEQIAKLNEKIERMRAEHDAIDKEEEEREKEHLIDLQNRKKNMEAAVGSLKGDADNFQTAAERERIKLEDIDNNARNLRRQIEQRHRLITGHSNKRTNKYAAFGDKMQQLMAKIQSNMRKFQKPPKGPLGACFRVKDPEFAVLVEGVLWNNLDNFVVATQEDLSLMKKLINEVYKDDRVGRGSSFGGNSGNRPMPAVILTKFANQVYDVSQNLVSHPSAPTIFELLEVEDDDPVIYNTLIDISEVERILLFKKNTDACQVLKNWSERDGKLKQAFSLDWYKILPAPRFAAHPIRQRSRAVILKSGQSAEAEIEDLKAEIRNLQIELDNLEPQKAEIRNQEDSFRSSYSEKVNEMSEIKKKMFDVSNEIKRQQLKMTRRDKRCDLTSFYEELEEHKDEVKRLGELRETATKEFQEIAPTYRQNDEKKKELDEEIENLSGRLSQFQDAREKLKSKREDTHNVINKMKGQLNKLDCSKQSVMKELESHKKSLEETTNIAISEGSTERIETRKTPAELKKRYEVVKIRIRETEAQLGNVEELQRKLKETKAKYKKYINEYTPASQMHKLLCQISTGQSRCFMEKKQTNSRTLSIFFQNMAIQRGYEGRLLVDYETKELYYFVCPDGHSLSKTVRAIDAQNSQGSQSTNRVPSAEQAKQNKILKKTLMEYSLGLSGGERSFATICFIMAIWQVMECPFYMLDEFDVFMDAFNRKTSQLALTTHAKRFSMKQFVLFTPLDLGDVPGPEEATLLRLVPPRRNIAGKSGDNAPSTSKGAGPQSSNDNEQDNGPRNGGGRSSENSVENIDPLGEPTDTPGKAKPASRRRQGRPNTVMGVRISEQ